MSILVTGGSGYIGSHMVYELADAGERVVVLDNLSAGFDWAVAKGIPLIVGDTGDQNLVAQIIREHNVDSIVHFAAWLVVPDSVKDPLGYYKNNTVNSRALIETAIKVGVRQFIFSSTCAMYGNPAQVPVTEDTLAAPISPYGWSKLMTEIMLRDAGTAHDLRYVILRYFNVAGADPKCRTGQSTKNATQLIKVAVEVALGLRSKLDIYGSDYPTPDGTCIRDYIHVSDLVRAHSDALRCLRAGSASATLNCGYGHGFSVREVVEMVKRVSGVDFKVEITARRPGDPHRSSQLLIAPARCSGGHRSTMISPPSSRTRLPGSRSCNNTATNFSVRRRCFSMDHAAFPHGAHDDQGSQPPQFLTWRANPAASVRRHSTVGSKQQSSSA